MEYQEIINKYLNNQLDIQELKSKFTISKPLQGRAKFRALTVVDERTNLKLNVVNALVLQETEDNIEEFINGCNAELNSYFAILINSIRETKAWKFIDKIPSKYTVNKFNILKVKDKFAVIEELNRLYLNFLEYQKIADIRDCLRNNPNSDIVLKKVEFINLMFNNLKSYNSRTEFFLLNKKFLMALVDSQKKRTVKFEEYMMSKNKNIVSDFEYFSKYFSAEDFSDIAENLLFTSKTLKTSLSNVIEIFSEISETELEMNYLNEEFEYFNQLKEKLIKFESIGIIGNISLKNNKKDVVTEKNIDKKEDSITEKKVSENIEKIDTQEKVQNNLADKNKENLGNKLENQNKENVKEVNKENNSHQKINAIKNVSKNINTNKIDENKIKNKEKIIPIIISWFERNDITLTRTLSIPKIADFIESLKTLEDTSGKKCKIMIITNSNKETTIKRVLELEKRCRARGLINVVDGAFGAYCSFFVDGNGNCKDVAVMSENNRYKVIKVLERMEYFDDFKVLEDNKDFIRYQMLLKKDNETTLSNLKMLTDKVIKDPNFSRHPLLILPHIESKEYGVDVIMKSQVEGWLKLSEFFEFKYDIEGEKIKFVRIDEDYKIEKLIIAYYENFIKGYYKNEPEKVKMITEIINRKLKLFKATSVDKIIAGES